MALAGRKILTVTLVRHHRVTAPVEVWETWLVGRIRGL